MRSILKKWSSFTQYAPDLSLPLIMIYSNDVVAIEQFYNLLSFSRSKIILNCKIGTLEICGEQLSIQFMYPGEIKLQGHISHIQFHTNKGEVNETSTT